MLSFRALIERMLPWYNPDHERERNVRSERAIRRSEVALIRAERAIADYQAAEQAQRK